MQCSRLVIGKCIILWLRNSFERHFYGHANCVQTKCKSLYYWSTSTIISSTWIEPRTKKKRPTGLLNRRRGGWDELKHRAKHCHRIVASYPLSTTLHALRIIHARNANKKIISGFTIRAIKTRFIALRRDSANVVGGDDFMYKPSTTSKLYMSTQSNNGLLLLGEHET